MATQGQGQDSFPLPRAFVLLTGAALILYSASFGLVAFAFDEPQAATAVHIAALAVWLSGLLGLVPVGLLASAGLMPTVYGYFMGAAVRVLIVLGATAWAIALAKLPALPWVVTLFAMYLPLLFLEVSLVGRFIWSKRLNGSTPPAGQSPRDDDGDASKRLMEACA